MKVIEEKFNLGYVIFTVMFAAFAATLVLVADGCSSTPTREATTASKDSTIPPAGPSILYVRTAPGPIDLNRNFEPARPAEVLADIKDYSSKINDVKLQFVGVPLEISMEKVSPTTWRARLQQQQLELLAVSGQTIRYEAHVIASDEDGRKATTKIPVDLSIRAPEIAISGAPPAPGAG